MKIQIKTELEKMKIFSEKIRSGKLKSGFGKSFKTIVNIGIGGSDLGPKLVINALKTNEEENELKVHFISNIDEEGIFCLYFRFYRYRKYTIYNSVKHSLPPKRNRMRGS